MSWVPPGRHGPGGRGAQSAPRVPSHSRPVEPRQQADRRSSAGPSPCPASARHVPTRSRQSASSSGLGRVARTTWVHATAAGRGQPWPPWRRAPHAPQSARPSVRCSSPGRREGPPARQAAAASRAAARWRRVSGSVKFVRHHTNPCTAAIIPRIIRDPLSQRIHGWAAPTAVTAIRTRSVIRWIRRGRTRNAASGPMVMAACSISKAPTTEGTAGVGLCSPEATTAPPSRYSTSWCIQNGRFMPARTLPAPSRDMEVRSSD